MRNLKRGASVSSELAGEEDIESGSNSDIRDDEIAEQLDLQDDDDLSVIEDDQVNLNDAESEESLKRGGRRTTRAARSRHLGY